MSSRVAMALLRRQRDDDLPDGWVIDSDGVARPWWYSKTGYIVKWSVFFGLVMLISLYLLIGYLHAKRRLRKGLIPLGYHRWLISKRELAVVDPRYAYPQATAMPYYPAPNNQYYYGGGNAMNMQPVPPPPVYEPPSGATKTDPDQWTRRPEEANAAPAYGAPMGPPPTQQPPQQQQQQQQQYGMESQSQQQGGQSAADKAKGLAGKALGFLKRK